MNRVKHFWDSLNQNIVVNQRELVLGLAVCTLAGFVIGMMMAPPKEITIGSGNTITAGIPEDEKETPEESIGE